MSDTVPAAQALASMLRRQPATVVLTGAGVSAESGIPTFRQAQTGLWSRYNPQELATEEAFRRDPALVWQWYQWRRSLVAKAHPNAAHQALSRLQRRLNGFTLITQNVDDLHERAGSRDVVHLHGDLLHDRCQQCARASRHVDDGSTEPPHCSVCGGLLRPAVVWFGEALPADALRRAVRASSAAELMLVIGTSAQVYPAAGLADQALAADAFVAEVNPSETPFSARATLSVRTSAAAFLPRVVDLLDGDDPR